MHHWFKSYGDFYRTDKFVLYNLALKGSATKEATLSSSYMNRNCYTNRLTSEKYQIVQVF